MNLQGHRNDASDWLSVALSMVCLDRAGVSCQAII